MVPIGKRAIGWVERYLDQVRPELVVPPDHGTLFLTSFGEEFSPHRLTRACVRLGIVATCRAQGVPAQAYLAWAFERLGTHRAVFDLPLEAMTPAAFEKSLA